MCEREREEGAPSACTSFAILLLQRSTFCWSLFRLFPLLGGERHWLISVDSNCQPKLSLGKFLLPSSPILEHSNLNWPKQNGIDNYAQDGQEWQNIIHVAEPHHNWDNVEMMMMMVSQLLNPKASDKGKRVFKHVISTHSIVIQILCSLNWLSPYQATTIVW